MSAVSKTFVYDFLSMQSFFSGYILGSLNDVTVEAQVCVAEKC